MYLAHFYMCALLMLMVKQNSDIHANRDKSNNFWLFPFVYLIVGIGLNIYKIKTKFATLMSWHFFYHAILFRYAFSCPVKLKRECSDTEILNNPYLLASQHEQWATKVFVLLKYFILCWFLTHYHPITLSTLFNCTFASWDTLLSLVLHLGLMYAGFKLILKKHILGFAIVVLFVFLQ